MPDIDERLRSAARRYYEAASEVRSLTKRLGRCDDQGQPWLSCTHPRRELDGEKGLGIDCRKLSLEPDGPEDARWYRHRDPEDWCNGCVEIQRIVDARRAAKLRRGHALTALSNIARHIPQPPPLPSGKKE